MEAAAEPENRERGGRGGGAGLPSLLITSLARVSRNPADKGHAVCRGLSHIDTEQDKKEDGPRGLSWRRHLPRSIRVL